jgi:hypothetical protein
MADRRGPKSGYEFGNKKQYRRNIWATFAHYVERPSYARALLMPSIEGAEIEVATQRGFQPQNLCAVDMNPAIVATLKRRYPRIRTAGVDIGRAGERLGSEGWRIDVANLDLTGCISSDLLDGLIRFMSTGVMETGLVAVTVLRGREHKEVTACLGGPVEWCVPSDHLKASDVHHLAVDEESCRDQMRLACLSAALEGTNWLKTGRSETPAERVRLRRWAFLSKYGIYRSSAGSQTMLWGVYKVHEWPCGCDLCALSFASLIEREMLALGQCGRCSPAVAVQTIASVYNMSSSDLIAATNRKLARHPSYRDLSPDDAEMWCARDSLSYAGDLVRERTNHVEAS